MEGRGVEQEEKEGRRGKTSEHWVAVIFLPIREARVGRTARIVVGKTRVFAVHVTAREKNIIVNIEDPFTNLERQTENK